MNAKAEKQENTRCHVGQAEASVFSSLEWAPCSVGLTGFWRRMGMDVPCEMENDDEMTIVNRGHLPPTPDKGAEPWGRVSQGSGLVGEAGGGGGGAGIQDLLCRALEVTWDWEPEARSQRSPG